MEHSKPIIVITGVSGYLGSHVCLIFLQSGKFKVRGTVRDKNNAKKIQPLKDAFGEHFNDLELVEADLLNADSLERAIEGCQYVVHTASPVPNAVPRDENVIIKPAVDGTLAVMRAAHKHKVKRVVITSSMVAIMNGNFGKTVTEDDWSELAQCQGYDKSKTLAEKAAWDYVKNLPEQEKFELAVINPGFIVGPNLIGGDFSSGWLFKQIMMGKLPGAPVICLPIVDVRDAAQAHYNAIIIPEARNQRFILGAGTLWFKEISQILKDEFGKDYNINAREMRHCLLKTAACFSREARILLGLWGKEAKFKNDRSVNVLGIQYREIKESIISMAYALIKVGVVRDKRKVKVPLN